MKRSSADSTSLTSSAESFRLPAPVNEVRLFKNGEAFSVCPRCRFTLEREYQRFCDRCGQALDWKSFSKALIVLIP